jgi:hypothetical protein
MYMFLAEDHSKKKPVVDLDELSNTI